MFHFYPKKRVLRQNMNDRLFGPVTYECSACGNTERNESSTCPRCGAAMTGKKTQPDWIEEAAFMDLITGGFGK